MKAKIVQLSILFAAFVAVVVFFVVKLNKQHEEGIANGLDLKGNWTWVRDNKSEVSVKLPDRGATFLKPYVKEYTGWLHFNKEIEVPTLCRAPNKGCNFVVGEAGDTLQLKVNGYVVGTHGGLPPNYVYRKNHPVNIFIPAQIIDGPTGKALLEITTYSPKLAQTGVRSLPMGIYSEQSAEAFALTITLRNIILPIVVSGLMLLIGTIIALFALNTKSVKPELWSFFYYCFITGLYLISFSEVPREFADLSAMGFIHWFMRVLFDWSAFYMAICFFKFPKRAATIIHSTYALVILAFVVLLSADKLFNWTVWGLNGFDSAYFIMRCAAPLVFLPYAIGAFAPFKSEDHKSLGIRLAYLIVLPLNTYDIGIFHHVIQGSYNLKFFPIFIGVAYGWYFLKKTFRERVELLATKNEQEIYKQIVHDIRSPLAALKALSVSAHELNENQRNLLSNCIERVSDLAQNMLVRSSELEHVPARVLCLDEIVREIIEEKRLELTHSEKSIEVDFTPNVHRSHVKVNPILFKRAFSNVLNNSVESIQNNGRVSVEIEKRDDSIVLAVSDTGSGIPGDILGRLGKEPISFGKKHGNGRGFKYSKETFETFGAKVRVSSKLNVGTKVQIELPEFRLS